MSPRSLFVSLCLVLAGFALASPGFADAADSSPGEATPVEPAVDPGWTLEKMMDARRVGDVRVSPDGSKVVYTVNRAVMDESTSEYRDQVWLAAADGSWTRPLTFDEAGSDQPRWSKDGRFVTFVSARSGAPQVWLLPIEGGEPWRLTDAKPAVGGFRWSPDGKRLLLAIPDGPSDEEKAAQKGKDDARVVGENDQPVHLWVAELGDSLADPAKWGETIEPRRLTEGAFHAFPGIVGGADWSPDSSAVVFVRTPTTSADDWPKADLAVVDVDSGEIRSLAVSPSAEAQPIWSPDGEHIAFLRSDDPPTWGFALDVWVVPAAGGEPRPLGHTHDRGFTRLIGWSADSSKILFTETRGTVDRLAWLPIDGSPSVDLDTGNLTFGDASLSPSGDSLVIVAEGLHQPQEVHLTPVDRFAPVALSRANAHLADLPLPEAEVVTWTSSDGLEIEGILVHPLEREGDARVPLLLNVHGGPAGVFEQRWLGDRNLYPLALLAREGIAVLRVNPRGSSGYGRDFRYANYEDWGGGDYRDLMAGVDHLVETGLADPERLGVAGWSYGGYMTSWILTQTDRFAATAVGAGVTNLRSFVGTADIPSFLPDYFRGEYWDRPEVFAKHSPIHHVGNAKTPTLILHGEADARVPVTQGHELRVALERRDVPVEMVVYPRMPHGPNEPKHLRDLARRHLEWFTEHLLDREPITVASPSEPEDADSESEDSGDGDD